MTDPRRYRVAIDPDIMEQVRPLANRDYNRNATKAINRILRAALKAKRP